jgi:hypothetical protein
VSQICVICYLSFDFATYGSMSRVWVILKWEILPRGDDDPPGAPAKVQSGPKDYFDFLIS